MNKLISLELKRNSLRSYHTGVFISGVLMLGLLYLLAAIPKLDPSERNVYVISEFGWFNQYYAYGNLYNSFSRNVCKICN